MPESVTALGYFPFSPWPGTGPSRCQSRNLTAYKYWIYWKSRENGRRRNKGKTICIKGIFPYMHSLEAPPDHQPSIPPASMPACHLPHPHLCHQPPIATGCHLIACVKCIEKVYLRCNCNCGSTRSSSDTVSGMQHPHFQHPGPLIFLHEALAFGFWGWWFYIFRICSQHKIKKTIHVDNPKNKGLEGRKKKKEDTAANKIKFDRKNIVFAVGGRRKMISFGNIT